MSDIAQTSPPQGLEKVPHTASSVMDENVNPAYVDMEAYRQHTPLWKRVWRHSLTQMMLLSIQAFCGPAMDDAIAGKKLLSQHCVMIKWTDSSLQVWVAVVWQPRKRLTRRMVTLLGT